MAYEVETKDGIVIRGIPDDIPANHPTVQAKVTKARAERDSASVTADMSGGEKFLAGIGMGMSRVGRGVGQVFGLIKQDAVDEAAPRDAALGGTGAGMAGEVVGNLATTAIPGVGVGGLLAKGAARVLPAFIAPTVGAAATGGAISAATTPVPTGDTRLREAGIGAAGGAVGDVAARTVARVAQPIMQTDAVKKLLGEGVVPTPGQAVGQNTLAGTTEQKLESLPLVGQIIQNAKQRAVGEVNLAQLKRSVPAEDAAQITKFGRAGIVQADEVLSKGYDDVLDAIGKVSQPFVTPATPASRGAFNPATGGYPKIAAQPQGVSPAVTAIANDADLALNDEVKGKLLNIVKLQFSRPGIDAKTGEMSADLAKQIDSTLGRLARNNSASQNADDRSLGLAIRAVQGQWRDAIRQAAPDPATAARLDALNSAYANFVRTERAASYVGARDGVFSPSNLQTSVKASDSSPRHKAFAEGRALGQDLSEAAKTVLGNTVPDSGTAGRALVNMALLGGASGGGAWANDHFGGPGYLSALALAPLAYSRPGSRYMIGDLIPGQQTLAEIARRAAPATAQGGRALNEAWQNRSK